MHDSFKKLKLHDLVGKVVYEYIGRKVHDCLGKTEHIPTVKAFLSNSIAGFEIEYNFTNNKKEIGVGVQLQGTDYRHYIKRNYIETEKPVIDIADEYRDWLLDKDQNLGKGKDKEKLDYKKFDKDKFLYLSRTVDLNFEELCEIFKHSLDGARTISEKVIFKEQLY